MPPWVVIGEAIGEVHMDLKGRTEPPIEIQFLLSARSRRDQLAQVSRVSAP